MVYVFLSFLIYGAIIGLCFLFFKKFRKFFHVDLLAKFSKKRKGFLIGTVIFTVLACTIPMLAAPPTWTGKKISHRNQYELMADAILDGKLYLDDQYSDKSLEKLEKMENPYDCVARDQAKFKYHWDHVYYNGHYYMYFGVAPVFMTFIPFKILTGHSLPTIFATQLYTALIIIGIFALFYLLCKKFFKSVTFGMYVILGMAFSVMSTWYAMTTPILYCTAITAGIMTMIWSLFFYFRAVFFEKDEKGQIIFALVGATLGAIAFACRPPIALANVIVLPLFIEFIKNKKKSGELNLSWIWKTILIMLPYFIIGGLLMLYNYSRFGKIMEFGQAYQLTVTDQTSYSTGEAKINVGNVILNSLDNLFGFHGFKGTFPYVTFGGAFINFPILLIGIIGLFNKKVRKFLRDQKLSLITKFLIVTPIIITLLDALWSPFFLERYRMDIYFVLGIMCFIVLCAWHEVMPKKKIQNRSMIWCAAGLFTIGSCMIFFFVPNDGNFAKYHPTITNMAGKSLTFGLEKTYKKLTDAEKLEKSKQKKSYCSEQPDML